MAQKFDMEINFMIAGRAVKLDQSFFTIMLQRYQVALIS